MMEGDEDGLRALLRVHGSRVKRFLGSRFRNDVVEGAFWEAALKVWGNAHQYDESLGDLGVWFIAIAHNCARDIVKAEPLNRRLTEGINDPYVPSQTFDLEKKLSKTQKKRTKVLRQIVDGLPPAQRRIIEADITAGGESVNSAELARELGLSNAASVRSQRSKAKATVTRKMKEQGLINDEEGE